MGELFALLRAACPSDVRVMLAPTDYQPTDRRSLQPDLLVARRADVGDDPISAPLLLAVEVLSPSTRSVDLLLKHGVYAESGVASYWVVDPAVPSVRAWRLRGRRVRRGRRGRGRRRRSSSRSRSRSGSCRQDLLDL